MFAGDHGRNILQLVEDDDDQVINLSDFEFNLNLQTQIQELEPIREFSKQISYISHQQQQEAFSFQDHQDHDHQFNVKLCQDDWFMILDYIPFPDFCKFSLVCSSFAELLTFNRRHLVMRGILKDFPSLLKDHHFTTVESLGMLASERSPSDDLSNFQKSLFSDMIYFLIEKKRYKQNLWKFIEMDKIREMDERLFILPFRSSMIINSFYDFLDIPQELLNCKKFIMKFFEIIPKACSKFFIFLNENLKNDEEIVKLAVSNNGWLIKFVKNPNKEIVNLAFQSKYRFDISPTYNQYRKVFEKYNDSLIHLSDSYYELLDEKSIVSDYRKSKKTNDNSLFRKYIQLDSKYGFKNIQFLLLFAYFEQSPELKDVLLYYYYNTNNTTKNRKHYLYVDDLITDMMCFPDMFEPSLSNIIQVPTQILNCKTREITISQILNRILNDNFTFNTILNNVNMKFTKSSIEYLRKRLIHQSKVTPLFTRLYFTKYFEIRNENDENNEIRNEIRNENDENERIKLWNEISKCRKLNLKMLKYYPNYYSQLSDEFKNEKEFKAIAMENLKCNLKYFNVENNDDEFVMALSGNFKRNIKILKSKYGKENIKERIKRIFQQENGRIRKEWLNWPRVYDLYQFHLCYLYTDMEHVFTTEDQIEMIDHGTPAIVKKIAITNDERILERIRMKNLLDIWFSTNSTSFMVVTFRYCLSYKSHQAVYRALDRTFITLQKSDQFLSKVLQVVPKFVKVFFTVRKSYYYDTRTVIDFPFELIRELALENQRIVHYLPRNIQKRLKNPFSL